MLDGQPDILKGWAFEAGPYVSCTSYVDLFTFSMQQHFRLHIPGLDSDARGEHDAPLWARHTSSQLIIYLQFIIPFLIYYSWDSKP